MLSVGGEEVGAFLVRVLIFGFDGLDARFGDNVAVLLPVEVAPVEVIIVEWV